MRSVAIIDYNMGNLDSIVRAVEECGGRPFVVNNPNDLERAGTIIIPGVGAFSEGMANIRKLGLSEALQREVIEKHTPILGICLGMQLMAEKGYEGGETEGLGWIDGEVKRFESISPDMKIPHVGWNEVELLQPNLLFKDIPPRKDFYFTHSYKLKCEDENDILAQTSYFEQFVSAVSKGNIFGVQFHPEKSQRFGLQLLRNFLTF